MKKEYEMPDEYKRQLEKVLGMIEQRDRYERILPTLPPEVQKQARPAVRELSASIESAEQKLAAEYERYQTERRLEDERRSLVDDGKPLEGEALELFNQAQEAAERLFIIIKHKKPHLLEQFKQQVFADMPPDLIEEFYESVARREALELDELLKEP